MDKIKGTVKAFLEKYGLIESDLNFIVAFSGGYDSICLLHALKDIVSNKIIAIHLNHKWRRAESDTEEQNCKEFCKSLGIELYSEALPDYIAHTETAARTVRYEFFERCAEMFNSRVVFTAHNKNDNAETLIYRICMGTGINGLQGIAPVRGIFYRPLLDISRSEIERYCINNNLKPNTDSSNFDTKYKRNFIRIKVLPLLLELNPNTVDNLTSLSAVAQEETEIIKDCIKTLTCNISKDGKIKTKEFLKLSDAFQCRIIYDILLKYNLDYDRKKVLRLKDFITENSGSKSGVTCSLTDNLRLFTNEKYVEVITKNTQNFSSLQIKKEGKYNINGWIFELDKYNKPVKTFPKETDNFAYANFHGRIDFELRHRRNGDIIRPFGLGGTQKLKKYLNEKKIPNHEKDNMLFLADKNEILWAIGAGISDRIKVDKVPTHRLYFYKDEDK